MHIFVCNKNKIAFIFIIIGIICLFFSFYFSCFFSSNSIFCSLDSNSYIDDSLQKKISDLYENSEKIVYLTFDDGPNIKATGKILDILKAEDVKATFFVLGKCVKEHPELVKREFEEGHFIANHGYSHSNKKLYESKESFVNEIINTDKEISNAIGVSNYCSHVFRFPNGFMSSNYHYKKLEATKLLKDIGYVYVDWNCLNKDSERKISNYELLKNLKITSKNKGTLIVLMHDTCDVNNTPSVLKDSISYFKKQGYVFRNFYDFVGNN